MYNETYNSIIEFKNVSKSFGSFLANDNLSFRIQKGTIHAIIGENGAGKSTAMKMLFGLEKPSAGNIFYKGLPANWTSPRAALASGIGMVHQHFMLSNRHTALDNVILTSETAILPRHQSGALKTLFSAFSLLNRNGILRELEELANSLKFEIPWGHYVENLPVGVQQQIEIMKLIHSRVDTMIFDEPTAVLSLDEKAKFLEFLKKQKSNGKTVVLITHKLQEVKDVADEVTIFRRGRCIGSKPVGELSIQQMADQMVGHHINLVDLPRANTTGGFPAVKVEKLTVTNKKSRHLLKDISFNLSKGEVIGVAGIEGNGQSELLNFLCGPKDYLRSRVLRGGHCSILDKDGFELTRSQLRSFKFGVIPADRLNDAILVDENLVENDLLGHDQDFYDGNFLLGFALNRRQVKNRLRSVISDFNVLPGDLYESIGKLSGGNQQKFVIGREFSRSPKLIFLAEPTRGVDVGSIEMIHREILKRRDEGAAILLFSSQIEELMALSDRIYVMFEGSFIKCLERSSFSETQIGRAMSGVQE